MRSFTSTIVNLSEANGLAPAPQEEILPRFARQNDKYLRRWS